LRFDGCDNPTQELARTVEVIVLKTLDQFLGLSASITPKRVSQPLASFSRVRIARRQQGR
jgi:hypothetical protein